MSANLGTDRGKTQIGRIIVSLLAVIGLTGGLVMSSARPARAELDPTEWDPSPYAELAQVQSYYKTADGKEYSGLEPEAILRTGDSFRIGLRLQNTDNEPVDLLVGYLRLDLSGVVYQANYSDYTCTPGNPANGLATGEIVTCLSKTFTVQPPIPGGESGGGYSLSAKRSTVTTFPRQLPAYWKTLAVVGTDSVSLVQNDPTLTTTRTDGSVQPGDTIVFNFTARNNGDFPWSNPTMTDTLGLSYTCTPTTVAAGASSTCTSAPYTVKPADATAGSVTNTGHITVQPAAGSPVTADSGPKTVLVKPALTVGSAKLTMTGPSAVSRGGDVTYNLTVTNTGQTATTDPVVVSDPLPSQIDPASVTATAPAGSGTITPTGTPVTWTVPAGLAPGAAVTATVTGKVKTDATPGTGALVNTGQITSGNCAGADCSATVTTDITDTTGALTLTKSAAPSAGVHPGDTVTYTLTVRNSGAGTLRNVVVTDATPQFASDAITCAGGTGATIATLTAGQSVECTLRHTFTDAEVAAGGLSWGTTGLTNTATAAGQDANGVPVSSQPATATTTFTVTPSTDMTKDATYPTPIVAGSVINYTVNVTYTGDGPLSNAQLSDPMLPGLAASCSPSIPSTVTKGFTTTCTGSHTVTDQDIIDNTASGSISNTVTLSGRTIWNQAVSVTATKLVPLDGGEPLVSFTGSKSASVTSANPGDTISYTVKARNSGKVTASNVVITDSMNGATPRTIPASQCTWPGAASTLAPGAEVTCSYDYVVQATDASTTLHNAAKASGSDGTTTYGPTDLGTADVQVSSGTDLSATKTNDAGNGGRVIPGQTFRYTINLTNSGDTQATGVTVSDKLPDGLIFLTDGSNPGWHFNATSRIVSNDPVNVGAHDSHSIAFAVQVDPNAVAPKTYENFGAIDSLATIDECVATPGKQGCFKDSSTVVLDDSNITMEKDNNVPGESPRLVKAGDTFDYTIKVNNSGNTPATVTVIDQLPAGLEFASTTQAGWATIGTTQATSSPIAVGPTSSNTISIKVRVLATAPVGQQLLNVVAQDGVKTPDQCVANPDQTGCAKDKNPPMIPDHSGVKIEKSNSLAGTNPPVKRGQSFTYTIKATNTGSQLARQVRISDTLPAGLELDGAQSSAWDTDLATNKVSLKTPVDIRPGAANALIWDIKVKVSDTAAAGTLQNIAVLDDQDPGQCSVTNPSNACGVDPNPPTVDLSDLTMTKANDVSGNKVAPLQPFSYTFTVTNAGTQAKTGATISDWLPAGIELDPAVDQSATWNAIDGNGVVTSKPFNVAANGGQATVKLAVRVKAGTPTGTTIQNGGVIGTETDPRQCTGNATGLPGCAIDPNPLTVDDSDILISKVNKLTAPQQVMVGDTYTYEVKVTNNGSAGSSKNISLTEQLPAGLAFADDLDSAWTRTSATVATAGPHTLAGGGTSWTLPVKVTVTNAAKVGDKLTNIVAVDGMATPADCVTDPTTAGCGVDPNPPTVVDHSKVTLTKSNNLPTPALGDKPRVVPGQTFTYTIRATNSDSTQATGVKVSDTLPAGLTFVTPVTGWTLTGNTVTTTTNVPADGHVDLPALTVLVGSTASGTLQNVAVMDGQDPAQCSTTDPSNACAVDPKPPYVDTVKLSKKADAQRVKNGATVTYTFTLDNSKGTAAVPNYRIIDAVPQWMTFDPALNPDWEQLPIAPPGGYNNVQLKTPMTVPAGASPTVQLKLTVADNAPASEQLTNIATMANGRTPIDDCRADATKPDCVSDTTQPIVDNSKITIEKTNNVTTTPKTVKRGETFTYTITISNSGDDQATGVVITDRLPAGLSFSATQDSAWKMPPTGSTITSYPQTVDGHGSKELTLSVVVQPNATGKLKNVSAVDGMATVDDCETDPTLAGCGVDNDGPTVDNTDLSTTKKAVGIDESAEVKPGQTYSYEIVVSNKGTEAATGVRVIDQLPSGLQLDPAVSQAGTWSFNATTRVLTSVNAYTIAAGGSQSLTLAVQVAPGALAGTTIKNIGTITSDNGGETPIDECVKDPSQPGCFTEPGDHPVNDSKVTITKRNTLSSGGTQPLVVAGQKFSYQIDVANSGTSSADDIVVVDKLPAGLQFADTQSTTDWASTTGDTATSVPISLAGKTGRTLSLDVVVAATAKVGDTLTNVGAVKGAATPEECLAGTKTEGCAIDGNPPKVIDHSGVTLTKTNSLTGNPPRVVVGDTFFFTLSAKNTTTFTQHNVKISDTLPDGIGLDPNATQDSRWSQTNGGRTLEYTLETMAPGATVELRIYVVVLQGASGTIQNVGQIDDGPIDICEQTPRPPECDDNPPEVDNVTFTKSSGLGAGAHIKPGTAFTYTFTVTNSGKADKASYVIVDSIPTGVVMNPSPQTGWVIQPGTGSGGAGTIIKSTPFPVKAGETLTKTLTVKVADDAVGGTVIENVATVDGGKTPIDKCVAEPTLPECVKDPDKPVVDDSDITLLKTNDVTQSHKQVTVGEAYTYSIKVSNSGKSEATDVYLSDLLPTGLKVASGTQDDRWALPATGQMLKTKALTVPAEGSITLTLKVEVLPGAAGTLTNASAVDGKVTPAECLANPTLSGCGVDMTPVHVDNTAIAVDKKASVGDNAPVKPGQSYSYTFTATNTGSQAATGVKITDKLPTGLSLVTNTDFPTAPVAGIVTSRAFDLAAVTGSVTLTMNVKVGDTTAAGTVIKNLGSVIKPTDDGPTPADCEKDPTLPQCFSEPGDHPVDDSNITIVKTNNLTGTPPLVHEGQEFGYDLVVTNTGTATDTNVVVTDLLPAGLSFSPTNQLPWAFSADGTGEMAVHPAFTLAGKSSITLHLTVKVDRGLKTGTTLKNVSAVAGSTSGGTPVADCVTDDTKPGCGPDRNPPKVVDHSDVEVSKTNSLGSDPVVRVGDTFTYSITATNKGTLPVTNVKVSDTLPAGLALSGTPAGWQINPSTGELYFYTDLTPGQSVTKSITVVVVKGASGTIKNKAVKDDTPVDCDIDPTLPECDDNPPNVDNSDVTITKVNDLGANARVKPGQEYTYTITAKNSGDGIGKNVVVTDTLAAGLDYVPVTGDGWTLGSDGKTVRTAPFDLAANGGSKVFTLKVKVKDNLQPGTVIANSACTTGMHTDVCGEDDDPPTWDDSNIQLTKVNDTSATGRQVRVGDSYTYTITATNTGATTANGVVIVDKIPAGLEFTTTTQSGWKSLSGKVATSNPMQIAGKGSVSLTLQVTVAAGTAAGTELKNASAVDGVITPEDCLTNPNLPGCGVDDDPPSVIDDSTIGIVKASDKAGQTVKPGDTYTYTMTVTNNGAATAYNVKVSDTLPTGLEFNGAQPSPWTTSGTKATATLAQLTPGQVVTLTLTVKVAASAPNGPLKNVSVIGDRNPDDCVINPTLPKCGVDPNPPGVDASDVRLTKSNSLGSATTVKPGQSFTYTITATNRGAGAGTNVKILDKLPAGLEFYPTTQAGWSIDPAARTATAIIPTLAAGATQSLTLAVRVATNVPDGTALQNAARVWDPRTPDDPPNPDDCLTDPTLPGCGVDPKPPLADRNVMVIEKANDLAGTPLASRGQPVGYDITVRNIGYVDATGVSVTDRLPSALSFASATQEGWTISGTDAVASFTVPAGSAKTLHIAAVTGKEPSQLIRNIAALSTFTIEGETAGGSGTAGGTNVSAPTGTGKSIAQCVADPTQAGCAYDDIAGTGERTGVTVTKTNSVASGIVKVGESYTYTLTVRNTSSAASTGITLSDTLPTGLVFDGAQSGWTVVGQKATLAAPFDLAAGASTSFTLRVKVTAEAGTSIRNVAVMDDRNPDDCLVNPALPGCGVDGNPPVVDHGQSQLMLEKTATRTDVNGNGRLDAGDTITYAFKVTNLRDVPVSAGDLTVDDPMLAAAGIQVVCPTAAIPAGQTVTCLASAPYTITATDVARGYVRNSAVATSNGIVSSAASYEVTLCAACGGSEPLPTTGGNGDTTLPTTNGNGYINGNGNGTGNGTGGGGYLSSTGAQVAGTLAAALLLIGAGTTVLLWWRRRKNVTDN